LYKKIVAFLAALGMIIPVMTSAAPAIAHNTPNHCRLGNYYGSRWVEYYQFHTVYGGIQYVVYKHFDWFTGRSHMQWNACARLG
jgi:hypothetical protein